MFCVYLVVGLVICGVVNGVVHLRLLLDVCLCVFGV